MDTIVSRHKLQTVPSLHRNHICRHLNTQQAVVSANSRGDAGTCLTYVTTFPQQHHKSISWFNSCWLLFCMVRLFLLLTSQLHFTQLQQMQLRGAAFHTLGRCCFGGAVDLSTSSRGELYFSCSTCKKPFTLYTFH